jgi:hypothetical protein
MVDDTAKYEIAEYLEMRFDMQPDDTLRDAERIMEIVEAARTPSPVSVEEVADLRQSVIAFAGPWAEQWAREHELPKGHLHPEHYDLLERCGARMADFTRHDAALSARP